MGAVALYLGGNGCLRRWAAVQKGYLLVGVTTPYRYPSARGVVAILKRILASLTLLLGLTMLTLGFYLNQLEALKNMIESYFITVP